MAPNPEKNARFRRTITFEAIVFLVLLAAMLMAGLNSGNNLLFLVAGVMLAGVVVSLVAGRLNLSRIEVRRHLPAYVFAGHTVRTSLEITNGKRVLDSFGLNLDGAGAGGKPLVFLSIENGGKEICETEISFALRGLHRFPPITIRSDFPFGLFKLRRGAIDQQEIVVYPRIYDLTGPLGGARHIQDEFPQHLKGPGSGLYGVREYHHGEDAANINWKISAKLDKLILKETEREERRRVCIVFDNAAEADSEAAREPFEHVVSTAASLVWYLCRNRYSVKLVTRDQTIGYGDGVEHMHRMLMALALIAPAASDGERLFVGKDLLEGGIGVLVTGGEETASVQSTNGDIALEMGERGSAETL